LACALLVTLPLSPVRVRADCIGEETYSIQEDHGRVTVCLETGSSRSCPDLGLVRRDVETGEIVELTTCDGACFVDECVPAGTYQYGLAVPYSCARQRCATLYWEGIQVSGAGPGCTRTGAAPAPASGTPWSDSRLVCGPEGGGMWGPDDVDWSMCGCNGGEAGLASLGIVAWAFWRRRCGRG
jgi:hypothetical protein